jgi:hypothetical protein
MFSSAKLVTIAAGMYTGIILLPGMFLDSDIIPNQYLGVAMVACVLFVAGMSAGGLLFRFRAPFELDTNGAAFRQGLMLTVALQTVFAIYIFAAGPTSPLLAGVSIDDAIELALLREQAVKLNEDAFFVRMYSWARDVIAPITFILSVQTLRGTPKRDMRWLAYLGIAVAFAIGLWSGQKATVANYLLAAIIFSARSEWSMVRMFIKAVPVLIVLLIVVFLITLPQLFERDSDLATSALVEAIFHRVLISPIEVAGAYIFAIQDLHLFSRMDAVPLMQAFWTPGIDTIENRVALEFFYSGIESISANAPAFAYAFVLGGYVGCFFGGFLVMAVYKLSTWIVQSSGSNYMYAAFGALLSYSALDLLNSNYLGYLVAALMEAASLYLIGCLLAARVPARSLHGLAPASSRGD